LRILAFKVRFGGAFPRKTAFKHDFLNQLCCGILGDRISIAARLARSSGVLSRMADGQRGDLGISGWTMTIEKKGDRFHMYLRHRRSLINYAAPLLGSKDDAEDIVQDAYLRFVRETADEHMPPKTYLFRIVRNLSFNKRSRRKLENNVVESADIPWWALPQAVETPEAPIPDVRGRRPGRPGARSSSGSHETGIRTVPLRGVDFEGHRRRTEYLDTDGPSPRQGRHGALEGRPRP
jgi:hypothetical protein